MSQSQAHPHAVDFLKRLIAAQKELHRALSCADAAAIQRANHAISAIVDEEQQYAVTEIEPVEMEVRALIANALEWQRRNRELGRQGLRMVRRLCGLSPDPDYDGTGNLEGFSSARNVAVCI